MRLLGSAELGRYGDLYAGPTGALKTFPTVSARKTRDLKLKELGEDMLSGYGNLKEQGGNIMFPQK